MYVKIIFDFKILKNNKTTSFKLKNCIVQKVVRFDRNLNKQITLPMSETDISPETQTLYQLYCSYYNNKLQKLYEFFYFRSI